MTPLNTGKDFDLVLKTGLTGEDEQFLFACRGDFNTSITDNILLLTEHNLLELDTSKVAKKVYYLMVEGLQNITRHQHFDDTGEHREYDGGLFIIKRKKEAYSVTYGNFVDESVKNLLTEKLQEISHKDPSELKEYYLEILNNSTLSSKGGAGLGLVDMARKSSGELMFKFEPIPNGYFYYLNLTIAIDKELYSEIDQEQYINEACQLHKTMMDSDGLILFKGLLSESNVAILSNQIDTAVENDEKNRGLGLVMTELLRNVAKHAYNRFNQAGKPGVFLLQREEDYNMLTGNYIQERKKETVVQSLNEINKLTTDELNLMVAEKVKYRSNGKGLAHLRTITGHNFEHDISEHEGVPPYLTLKIQVKG